MAIITLLTDFGYKDEYVGVLKGVILSTAPEAVIVDINHGIEARDVGAAARALKTSYPYFPEGTIHVAVVDPGVGTQRAIIAASCDGHLFLAPDNGLLAPILDNGSSVRTYHVENEGFFRHPVSRTFHGRDVFAPVAAHLSRGIDLEILGPQKELGKIQPLEDPGPKVLQSGEIEGRIVDIDRFGNLITNIHSKDIAQLNCERVSFTLGDCVIIGMADAYAQGDTGEPIAILGSRDCIEIAIGFGHAASTLNLGKGDNVRVNGYSDP